MRLLSKLDIIEAYKYKGYPLREGIMEINIFGIRNSDVKANTFDDAVGVLYKDINGEWVTVVYEATTDPGGYARTNPMNHDGTAIIVPGFHKACYKLGLHKGQEAMEQIAPMTYVRDANKDLVLDFLYKATGWKVFKENGKTNIHRAGKASKLVDQWSYGCQVFAKEEDFLKFLKIIKSSIAYGYNNVFDYTLFEIEVFDGDKTNDPNYFK
jgi:hypothetical protein